MKKDLKIILIVVAVIFLYAGYSFIHLKLTSHHQNTFRAKVVQVVSSSTENNPDGTTAPTQVIKLQLLNGTEKGKIVTVNNDYIMLNKGDRAFLGVLYPNTPQESFALFEPDRLPIMGLLLIVFVGLVVFFGGMQGVRGLLTLAGSLVIIAYVLIPGILHGYPIIPVTIGVAALIIVLGSYITHGFNRTTTAAVIGMVSTIIVTGVLAYIVIHLAKLTGLTTEEDIYLVQVNNKINLVNLLLGGMIIGILGVLYDAAIGQAVAVEELHHIAPHLSRGTIFARAIRIGREHIGALVNTLAIAYVGVSLPLLLLVSATTTLSFTQTINQQLFATELIRTLIGSIGLVLAVPVTTVLAVVMLMKVKKKEVPKEVLEREREALEHFQHHH